VIFLLFLMKYIIDYVMRFRAIYVLFFCLGLSFKGEWVFSINDSLYFEPSLSSFFGSKEWGLASKEKKRSLVDDFIIREAAFLMSKKTGLVFNPSFYQKAHKKKRELLINYYYQTEISKMALDSVRFENGKKHLKEERFVYHILLGHSESSLRVPVERTKEEALNLSQKIIDTLDFKFFKDAVVQFSDDGSAKRNFGELGWISWGATVPSFEGPVYDASPQSFVGPIETSFGYHIAYIDSVRPSFYSSFSDQEFYDALLLRSTSKDVSFLKTLSQRHDSLIFSSRPLVFNDSLIFSSFTKNSSLFNKNDIVSFLKTLPDGVVCVFGDQSFGFDWFSEKISSIPPSSRPTIKDSSSFIPVFKTVLLQEEAYNRGVSRGLNRRDGFLKVFNSYKKDLLYSLYFKNLVNDVSAPDSSSVYSYYLKNMDTKYKKPKSLYLKEVRCFSRATADSLLGLYIDGEPFDSLVYNYSFMFNKKEGGFVGPVERSYLEGSLYYYFDKNLKEGDVGPIVENFDNSFSFYKVVSVYPEEVFPFNKVYNRISSLLYKEKQELVKNKKVLSFYKDLNIVKNDSIY
tara:strand:- start:1215 stop:2927 length:1713 start_codon:yes stop_codon:yes gene_type:complete